MNTPPRTKPRTDQTSPPSIIPREELRRKLRERIDLKNLRRSTNVRKKLVFDQELEKVGLSGDKFRQAMKKNVNSAKMQKVMSQT
jgi:hypothetical protein